jgi:subtilisin family serine protease
VAGIIAGNATPVYNHNGVAPGARLIAIQVFSWFSSCQCALSFTSDQILGLERVYALRTKYAISAVNMSLGGSDKYDGQSTCDLDYSIEKAAIDKLRSVGIATIIAAGNSSSYSYGLSAPACISSAISVGSIGDGSGQSATDTVCPFSNSASYLSFLAPGDEIYSSIPGNSYQSMRGTSMATPHVAGAWALVKSRYPGYTVSQVAALLTSNGKPITDPRNGVIIPRIKLDQILGVTFSVSGQVKLGGSGLAGVTLSDGSGHAATTDASGNYSITGLPGGSFTITPSRSDYTFTPINQSVTGRPSLTGANFSATQIAFTISGQVTTGGSGLAGVTVSNGAGHSALTDASGNYTLNGLPAGTYTITPSNSVYTFSPVNSPVQLGPDQSGIIFAVVPLVYFYFPLVQYRATP